jgi:hypothetical protein
MTEKGGINVTNVQTVLDAGQLVFEECHDFCSGCFAAGNLYTISGTRSNVNHLLEFRMIKGLNWLCVCSDLVHV